MVTDDLEQARRVADHVIFLWLGELVEQVLLTGSSTSQNRH
jgi:ABC-type phosphate transport system ATPase subunit